MPSSIKSVLGAQLITTQQSWRNEYSTIGVQVCRSGEVVNTGCTIKTRYVPPGSTCTIKDDATTRVDNVFETEPPASSMAGGGFVSIS